MPASIATVLAVLHVEGGAPARGGRLERGERMVREGRRAAGLVGVAQRLRDRVPGAVADLEQPLARGAAAAREAIAAVLARERAAELLEPVDRRLRVAGEGLDEPRDRRSRATSASRPRRGARASRRSPNAAWIPPCALEELFAWIEPFVASATRAPARSAATAAARPDGAAADHEHVESRRRLHAPRVPRSIIRCITESYFWEARFGAAAIESRMPQIADVMRPDFIEVAPGGHARRGRRADDAMNVGAVVVKDFGTLIGILTERDLLKAMAARVHSSEARVRQWMTADPSRPRPTRTSRRPPG